MHLAPYHTDGTHPWQSHRQWRLLPLCSCGSSSPCSWWNVPHNSPSTHQYTHTWWSNSWWESKGVSMCIHVHILTRTHIHAHKHIRTHETCGAMVGMSCFPSLPPMLECGFQSRLGLEFLGFSMRHCLKLIARVFLWALQFLPSFTG